MSEILVRKVDFEFPEDTDLYAIPSMPRVSLYIAAFSLTMPYLEPFLVKTMREASEHITDPELLQDMRGFNGQEACHYKCHRRLNELLKSNGYPELADVEARLARSYEKLSTKSLRTRLAYSAGFECMTNGFTTWLINKRTQLFAHASPVVSSFWLMHMIEETEHKTVAFDAYMAYSGQYLPRVVGVFHGSLHVLGYGLIGMVAALKKDGNFKTRTRVAEVFHKAELPEGVLEVVQGADEVGRAVVESDVDMIAFVGSQVVGREIMRKSSDKIRRVVLELGGKDPMIVCADADLEKAVEGAVAGTFRNCGQVCCGVERIYVERPLFDEFLAASVERVKKLRVGNGMLPDTDLGPMNRGEELERVERHLADAVDKGAKIHVGGKSREGRFFEPTVITGVRDDMTISREETFGPVMRVAPVDSVDEALAEANGLEFGLTATVWSRDMEKAEKIASRLQAGTIGINQLVASTAEVPWGGVKKSGLGRMLGPEAVREFTNTVNYRSPAV